MNYVTMHYVYEHRSTFPKESKSNRAMCKELWVEEALEAEGKAYGGEFLGGSFAEKGPHELSSKVVKAYG